MIGIPCEWTKLLIFSFPVKHVQLEPQKNLMRIRGWCGGILSGEKKNESVVMYDGDDDSD